MSSRSRFDEQIQIYHGESAMSAAAPARPVEPLRLHLAEEPTPVKRGVVLPEFLTLRDRLARPPLEQP